MNCEAKGEETHLYLVPLCIMCMDIQYEVSILNLWVQSNLFISSYMNFEVNLKLQDLQGFKTWSKNT